MSEVTRPTYKCDKCGKLYDDRKIFTEDVLNEGCSSIINGKSTYPVVGDQDYCSDSCFLTDIAEALNLDISSVL